MEVAMIRFKYLSLAATAAISLLLSPPANATSILIDQGPVTYDPATKLRWLDITATMGLSYNDVLTNRSVDYVQHGWRFATDVEVDKLYRDAGLPLASNPNGTFFFTSNPGDPGYANLEHDAFTLGSEIGWTLPSLPDYFTTGIFDIAPNPRNTASLGLTTLSILGYLNAGPGSRLDVTEFLDTIDKDSYVRNIGSFLVQDVAPVPIPGQAVSLAAILLGLAGLNLWRWKQLA
jgi:hypothetical protein